MAQCRVPHDLGPVLASLSRKNGLLCVSSLFMLEKMLVILRIWCQNLVPEFEQRNGEHRDGEHRDGEHRDGEVSSLLAIKFPVKRVGESVSLSVGQ